jgi:hypothetical protein
MRGVFLGAILIVVLMVLIKDGRFMRQVGMTGGCRPVAAPKGEDGAWQACDPGKLQGAPDLSRQGCKSVSFVGKTEYWRCPAALQGGPGS